MNLKTYSSLASRTESEYDSGGFSHIRFLHAITGMVTEAAELMQADAAGDEKNVLEEAGDYMWYINILFAVFEKELEYKEDDDFELVGYPFTNNIVVLTADITDALKRAVFYKAAIHLDQIFKKVNNIIFLLIKTLCDHGFSLAEALDSNIAKLKVRYPNGYSDYNAINRNIELEQDSI